MPHSERLFRNHTTMASTRWKLNRITADSVFRGTVADSVVQVAGSDRVDSLLKLRYRNKDVFLTAFSFMEGDLPSHSLGQIYS